MSVKSHLASVMSEYVGYAGQCVAILNEVSLSRYIVLYVETTSGKVPKIYATLNELYDLRYIRLHASTKTPDCITPPRIIVVPAK